MKKVLAVCLAALMLCLALPMTASAAWSRYVSITYGNFNGGMWPTDSATYKAGEIVTIYFAPPITGMAGGQLIQWHTEPPVVFIEGTSETTSPAKFIMPKKNVRIWADYETILWPCVWVSSGNFDGGSYRDDFDFFEVGDMVTIYFAPPATDPTGSSFVKWHTEPLVVFVEGTNETSSSATFIMPDAQVNFEAEFEGGPQINIKPEPKPPIVVLPNPEPTLAKLTTWQWILRYIFFGWIWM